MRILKIVKFMRMYSLVEPATVGFALQAKNISVKRATNENSALVGLKILFNPVYSINYKIKTDNISDNIYLPATGIPACFGGIVSICTGGGATACSVA